MSNLVEQKAVEALIIINKAINNFRLYPPTSAIVLGTIDRFYQELLLLLETVPEVIFSESERSILICGEKLSQKDQEKPQVAAFLEMMFNFGVKSITFDKGLGKSELSAFLDLLSRKPDQVKADGGLQKCLEDRRIVNIIVDKKIYVVKDGEHQLLASLELKDEEVIRYLLGPDADSNIDFRRLREMAKDTQWLTKIFQTGISQVMQQKNILADAEISERLVYEIGMLEKIVDQVDMAVMSQQVAKSVAALDNEMIGQILIRHVDTFLGGRLFPDIIDLLDDGRFREITEQVRQLEGGLADGLSDGPGGQSTSAAESVYSRLMATDKGRALAARSECPDPEGPETPHTAMEKIEESVRMILEGGTLAQHGAVMRSLSLAMDQLCAASELDLLDDIIYRMGKTLPAGKPALRNQVSEAMMIMIPRLPGKKQLDILDVLAPDLLAWITDETLATVPFQRLCFGMKDVIQKRIWKGQYQDALPLLDVFHLIYHGLLEKNDTIHDTAADIIRTLSSRDILDHLFRAYEQAPEDGKKSVGALLTRLGETPLNRLLDILRDQQDSSERVRILQLLTEVGQPAIPMIRERIDHNEPWYFLRNLAYLLGRIESRASAEALESFLMHQNDKVRQEALKSIHRIGAADGGPVLLATLPKADEAFQLQIIDELGSLKYATAVPKLAEMLKARSFIVSSLRADIEEKICTALGKIGSGDAVPILTEVGKSSFFTLKPYPDKVRQAATRALAEIKRQSSNRS